MFDFLFNPAGRVSRKGIWLFLLTTLVAHTAAFAADMALSLEAVTDGRGPVSMFVSLVLAWPSIAVPVKRFHDRGMSGWWIMLPVAILIVGIAVLLAAGLAQTFAGLAVAEGGGLSAAAPIGGAELGVGAVFLAAMAGVTLYQGVVLYFLPGDRGPNTYGANPRGDAEPFNPVNLERLSAKPKQADPHAPLPVARKLQPAVAQNPDWGFGRAHAGRGRPRAA